VDGGVVQVNFVLPQKTLREYNVQGHIFVDSGTITPLSGPVPFSERLFDFWSRWRLSAGFGIKLPVGLAGHLEIDLVTALAQYGSDRVQQGLQFGFSSDPFLRTRPQNL
jgi:hypothetical protein